MKWEDYVRTLEGGETVLYFDHGRGYPTYVFVKTHKTIH